MTDLAPGDRIETDDGKTGEILALHPPFVWLRLDRFERPVTRYLDQISRVPE